MPSHQYVPRLTYLRVKNYRALHDVEFKNLTPLTVLLGPNGSGKSTVFDVFAFLSECFTEGLRKAWDKRGRFKEMRTRGSKGPIEIVLKYKEYQYPIITYKLKIDENRKGPYILEEKLMWKRGKWGKPFAFLDFKNGRGKVISGEKPEETDERIDEELDSIEMIAVNTLGQFTKHPRVSSLRKFITDWYLSYLSAESTRTVPEAGPKERLSETGDNLPNVLQYLKEQHPTVFSRIITLLSERVPRLERIESKLLEDNRLLLRIKDAPFDEPILSKYASDGTLKMLAYLTMLNDPNPPRLIGIEEPENQLHPKLMSILSEEFRKASEKSQIIVTTHSPLFVNGIKEEELWILYRDDKGYTETKKASEMEDIKELMKEGAKLGYLWTENFFEFGDPLTNKGAPIKINQ